MTTRDPRSREHPTATPAGDGGRESTQSLNLEPPLDGDPSPEALGAALALGTHNRQITRIVSPPHLSASARHARRTDSPDDYLDAVLGSYRVIELLIPERLEAHLIVETIDEGTYIDPETGESVEPAADPCCRQTVGRIAGASLAPCRHERPNLGCAEPRRQ
jgi:hypothetical protein